MITIFKCEGSKNMARETFELYLRDVEITQYPKQTKIVQKSLKHNQKAVLISVDLKVRNWKLFNLNVIDI